MNGVMLTDSHAMPSASTAMSFIIVRSPPPISLLALTIEAVPSPLSVIWPVAGSPPAPWLHSCAARPMPWKTPGRTSLAFAACHFSFQPILSAAMLMQSTMPGLLHGSFASTLPSRLMFLRRNSTGSMPTAYAAFSMAVSSANVPFGWDTHRYAPER